MLQPCRGVVLIVFALELVSPAATANVCAAILEALNHERLTPFVLGDATHEVRLRLETKYPALKKLSRWLVAGTNPFAQQELWDDLEALDAAQVNLLLNGFQAWGYPLRYSYEMQQAIKNAPTQTRLAPLLLDPAMGCRAKAFLQWANEAKVTDLPFHEVRARYAAHLGEVTVYRGLVLFRQAAEKIAQEGILPPAAFIETPLLPLMVAQGPVGGIRVKKGLSQETLYHSVTEDEDLAAAAGYWIQYSAENPHVALPGARVFVFKIRLPRIDTVTRNNLGVEGEASLDALTDVWVHEVKSAEQLWGLYLLGEPSKEALVGEGRRVGPVVSEAVETFVFGKIQPSQVVSFREATRPMIMEKRRNHERPPTTFDSGI